jgi:multidrug resistance protein MdtO
MTLLAETLEPRRFPLWLFLRQELAPRPGRVAAASRIAVSCAVVVAIAMVFQIPLPAYIAYLVFLVSQNEAASTLLTGLVGTLAVTLAVAFSLLFYTIDASEPALRLPLMAGATFVAMFMTRTLALGPLVFLMGYVLVLSQTLIDDIPNLETLTRIVLWLWVVVALPAAWTVLLNLVIGENPTRLAHRTAARLLNVVAAALRDGTKAGSLERDRADAIALVELRERAGMLDHTLRTRAAIDTALIETLAELLTLLEILPVDTPAAARGPLAVACETIILAFERGEAPPPMEITPPESVLDALTPAARPVVIALAEALRRLATGIASRFSAIIPPPEAPSAKAAFVPDAFTNPSHVRFALKTTAAVMASYIIYSGLDWPGISTCITTCFFVALGTLGETMHKLTLRLSGAIIGGIVGGLAIVYLLPAMTDIGQLSLLIIAVSFACAWVSTSSELLSYAGMQAAFAFFLGVLQGYGPATDLTVLRDRVVGILLGNFLMSLIFSVFWPVSAADGARSSLAKALRALGPLLSPEGRAKAGARLAVSRALVEARRFASIAFFELRMLPRREWAQPSEESPFSPVARLAAAVFTVADQPADEALTGVLRAQDQALSTWFVTAGDRLAEAKPLPAAPDESAYLGDALAALPDKASPDQRALVEGRMLLLGEMANVAD